MAVFAARQTRDADGARARRSAAACSGDGAHGARGGVPVLDSSPAFGLARQRQATLDLEIKDRRDGYNDAVREYNAAIGRIPGSVVALIGAFPPLRPLDFEHAGS